MRILLLENSNAIERVVKLGLGAFPEAELKTCRTEQEFGSAVREFRPELVLVSDGFVSPSTETEAPSAGSWNQNLKGLAPDRVVLLASSDSSADALRHQGYAQVLRKPFKISEFRELVEPVWLSRRLQGEHGRDAKARLETVFSNDDEDTVAQEVVLGARGRAEAAQRQAATPTVTLDVAALEQKREIASSKKTASPQAGALKSAVPSHADASHMTRTTEASTPEARNGVSADTLSATVEGLAAQHFNARLAQLEQAVRGSVRADVEARFVKSAEAVARSQVDTYLNQAWPKLVQSLSTQVQTSLKTFNDSQQSAGLEGMRQAIMTELKAVVRQECEDALKSWMGEYSKAILKEVAREELSKFLANA